MLVAGGTRRRPSRQRQAALTGILRRSVQALGGGYLVSEVIGQFNDLGAHAAGLDSAEGGLRGGGKGGQGGSRRAARASARNWRETAASKTHAFSVSTQFGQWAAFLGTLLTAKGHQHARRETSTVAPGRSEASPSDGKRGEAHFAAVILNKKSVRFGQKKNP